MPKTIDRSAITADPNFTPSLRLLIEEECYSLTDVGLMFERTRERTRQWCEKRGIRFPENVARGLYAIRVWDDESNRFRPVSKSKYKADQTKRRTADKKKKMVAERNKRQIKMLETLVRLKESLGRDPTIREMATALFDPSKLTEKPGSFGIMLLSSWGSRKRSTKESYSEFRAALLSVGIRPRMSGAAGHIRPNTNTRQKYCKRGHEFEKYGRTRWGECKSCKNWRYAVRVAMRTGKPAPPEPIAKATKT